MQQQTTIGELTSDVCLLMERVRILPDNDDELRRLPRTKVCQHCQVMPSTRIVAVCGI